MVQKIYVGNLPFSATETEVRALFGAYGEVLSCAIPTDRDTGRPRGFAFVEMNNTEAANAIRALDSRDMGGRALRVNEAQPREERPASGGSRGPRRW